MFPLWDDVPAQRVPFVNYAVIVICSLVFLAEFQAQDGGQQIVFQYGMIPARVLKPDVDTVRITGRDRSGRSVEQQVSVASAIPPAATLVTSMFLHGGLMHLIGNMWFLFIFGDNVEDRFGHLGYAAMYLLSGLAAAILHIAIDPNSMIPTVGASGAIAGVMGGYVLLHPKAHVMALIPLGGFSRMLPVPAYIFLGIWFVFQVVSGLRIQEGGGGVAWWAHVGGFVAGIGMVALLRGMGFLKPPARPRLVYGFPQVREER